MAGEKRELQILVTGKDQLSGVFARMARSVQNFAKRAAGWLAGLARSFFSLKSAAISLAAGFLSGRLAKDALNGADAMSKLAQSTGVAVERLSALRTAGSFSNVDPDQLTNALRALQGGAGKVLTGDRGSGRIADAFGALGISMQQLRSLKPDELLLRIAGGLEQVGDETDKAAVLQRIFGDSYLELLPMLGQGEAALRGNIDAAVRYGAVVSGKAAAAAERFNDSLTALQTTLASLARDGVIKVAERLQPLIDQIVEFVAQNREGIANAIAIAIEWLTRLALTIGSGLASALDLFLNRWDEVESRLAKLPVIGGALQSAFGFQVLSDQTIEARKQIADLADEVVSLQRAIGDPGTVKSALSDGVNLVAQQAAAMERLSSAVRELQAAGGTATTVQQQVDAAQLRALSEDMKLLARSSGALAAPASRIDRPVGGHGAGAGDEEQQGKTLTFLQGFSTHLELIERKWKDIGAAGREAAQVIDNGLEGVVDSLADVVTGAATGRQAFKALAKSMLQDLARLISRLFVMYLLQSALGLLSGGGPSAGAISAAGGGGGLAAAGAGGLQFANGGVMRGRMGKVLPFRSYASGGIARSPQIALFGEGRGAEAFVPLPDGRTIPVTMRGGGGGQQITNVYNIQATDADSFRRMLARESATLGGIQQRELSRNHQLRGATRKAVG